MKKNLKTGGTSASDLPSTETRRADLSANRLRQSKREIAKRVTELADQATR